MCAFFFLTSAVVTLNKSPVFPLVPWVLLLSFSIYITVVVKSLCSSIDHPGVQLIRWMGSPVLPLDKKVWLALPYMKVPPITLRDIVTVD